MFVGITEKTGELKGWGEVGQSGCAAASQWVIATPSSQYFRLKIILCQKLATRASPTLFCDETSQLLAGNLEIRV